MNLNICRACLSKDADNEMKRNLCFEGKRITFIEVAKFCLGIEVYNSLYGSKLCSKCFKKLREFYKFKTLALKNDSLFKKLLSSSIELTAVKLKNVEHIKNCVETIKNFQHHTYLEDTYEPEIEINGNDLCSELYCDNLGGIQDDSEVQLTSTLEFGNKIKEENEIKVEEEQCDDDILLSVMQKIKYEFVENEPDVKNNKLPTKRKSVKYKACSKEQGSKCVKSVANFKEHKNKHLPIDQKKKLKCRHCDKEFSSYGARLRHEKFKHFGKIYKCDRCGKAVVNLRAHMLTMHERSSLKFKCFVCEHSFISKSKLETHVLSLHTKERSFKCEICEKSFSLKSTWDRHRRQVHEQEKSFMCQFCSKSFFKKYHLQLHIRSHTKEKPYKCKECGRGFGSSSILKQHMTIHSEAKNFKCTLCEMSFARLNYLRSHMLSHTKEKKHPCRYCGVKFLRQDHRKRHEFTAHEKFQNIPVAASEVSDK